MFPCASLPIRRSAVTHRCHRVETPTPDYPRCLEPRLVCHLRRVAALIRTLLYRQHPVEGCHGNTPTTAATATTTTICAIWSCLSRSLFSCRIGCVDGNSPPMPGGTKRRRRMWPRTDHNRNSQQLRGIAEKKVRSELRRLSVVITDH